MATTTARRRSTHPMSYYWSVVKDMNDSQKLELITLLAESVKPQMSTKPMKRYTMAELNAMLDEAEAEIAAGGGTPHEEVMREWEEELAREEQEMLDGYPYRHYTKAEMNAMLDEAERDFEAGLGIDDDDLLKEDEEEYERELAEERRLQLETV